MSREELDLFITTNLYSPVCAYCHRRYGDINKRTGKKLFRTVDHFIPTSKGGAKSGINTIYVCDFCNTLKGNLMPQQFVLALKKGDLLNVSKILSPVILSNFQSIQIKLDPFWQSLFAFKHQPPAKIKKKRKKAKMNDTSVIRREDSKNRIKENKDENNWLNNVYLPMCHPNPSSFHER